MEHHSSSSPCVLYTGTALKKDSIWGAEEYLSAWHNNCFVFHIFTAFSREIWPTGQNLATWHHVMKMYSVTSVVLLNWYNFSSIIRKKHQACLDRGTSYKTSDRYSSNYQGMKNKESLRNCHSRNTSTKQHLLDGMPEQKEDTKEAQGICEWNIDFQRIMMYQYNFIN